MQVSDSIHHDQSSLTLIFDCNHSTVRVMRGKREKYLRHLVVVLRSLGRLSKRIMSQGDAVEEIVR